MLTLGHSLPDSLEHLYRLEEVHRIHTVTVASERPLRLIHDKVRTATFEMLKQREKVSVFGEFEWKSLLRMPDRQGVDYFS